MKNNENITMIDRLWAITITSASSVWGYFQPVQHLIKAILIILALNIIVSVIRDFKAYKYRKKKKRRFSFARWFISMNFKDKLIECAIGVFIVMCLCIMYKTMGQEEEALYYIEAAKWFTLFVIAIYIGVICIRIEELWPNYPITKAIRYVSDKVVYLFTSANKMTDEDRKHVRNIVESDTGMDSTTK